MGFLFKAHDTLTQLSIPMGLLHSNTTTCLTGDSDLFPLIFYLIDVLSLFIYRKKLRKRVRAD